MESFSDVMNYFENLSNEHRDINYFVYGGSDRILAAERDKIIYPTLWVEPPEVIPMISDQETKMTWKMVFLVIAQCDPDEWKKEKYLMDWTFQIATSLMQRILSDSEEQFEISPSSFALYPVEGINNDHEVGWRVQFDFYHPLASCEDNKFKSVCPAGALAKFKWANESEDEFDVSLTDLSLPEDVTWSTQWSWSIDGGDENVSSSKPTITGSGSKLYIELKISSGDCELIASALIIPGSNTGFSVPYKYQ